MQDNYKEFKLDTTQFKFVFENIDRKLYFDCLSILISKPTNKSGFGIIVPKKNVKLATKRNLYKRVIREYCSKHRYSELFSHKNIVFIINKKAKGLTKKKLWILLENFSKKYHIP